MLISKFFKRTVTFWHAVFIHFFQDQCMARAAALTYTTLLSLVPLLTVSFAVLQTFPVFKEISLTIEKFIFNNFVAGSAAQLQQHFHEFSEHALQLSAPGLLFLLVTAVLMIFNMEISFNNIWKVKAHRHGVPAFLMYWAVLTLLPLFIAIGITVSTYIGAIPFVESAAQVLGLDEILSLVAPYLLTGVAFTLLYVSIPNRRVRWRDAFAGGAVAAVLFEVAKYGFAFYLTNFSTYQVLYGALAAIPIFLIWIYLSWVVILFGVEVSYAMSLRGKAFAK